MNVDETELLKYMWELKRKQRRFRIKRMVLKHVSAYRPGSKWCQHPLSLPFSFLTAKTDVVLYVAEIHVFMIHIYFYALLVYLTLIILDLSLNINIFKQQSDLDFY